ncbi:sensor histidine kinase [Azohydromonas aeria]|uniref:sensor histidine kinase n=1 Tax=Azohydromonas aeria TaxID=2590212 RepID=UPI0012F7E6E7|nr:ATP-binding protein [Azohydromonas aeria]
MSASTAIVESSTSRAWHHFTAPRESRWSLSRLVALSTALALLVAWGSVALLLKTKWDDAVQAEVRQNANLARALQEQTVRVIATVDQATLRLRDAVRSGDFTTAQLPQLANETGLAPKILVQLSLVGADGRFVGSNIDPDGSKTGPMDLNGREHVRVHLQPGLASDAALDAGGLFIGKPVLGKVSGRWTIQLTRRIDAADGRVLGVVVASLDPGYFEEVYRGVALGAQGAVTLVGTDRVVRARVLGGGSHGLGSTIGAATLQGRYLNSGASAGDYITTSSIDQVERIVAFRRVGESSLYVLVATATAEALLPWRVTRGMMLGLTALLTVAILAAAFIFLSGVRRLERKNEALRLSEAQAQAANQAKSEFLAAISHELRTPLTSIRGYAELMEHRLEHPRFRESAGLIRKGAEHLNELLTQILDLAKVEAGAMPVNLAPVALRPVLQGTLDFFELTARAKGLALELDVAAELPPQLVCDDLRLKQVLNNLLSNALKFTAQGGVRIEAARAGDMVCFHVVDTGPGIPAELHETVFEKFRQANGRVSYEHGGTGLGLALSRGLAELMGGTLTLQSAPGQGCRFTLSLPLRSVPAAT